MQGGIASQKLNYVIIYGEGCFNSKRQARRTVDLYQHYRGRVQFVVIDLDGQQSAEQQNLLRKYYTGSIPHVVILDQHGQALYDQAGEVGEESLSRIFDKALQ
jgi:thioredoxin-related protein